MGKSLAGKELGQGITQRKGGRYQARFTNRFGKRQTIYVNRTLVYARCDDENDPMCGKWRFAFHDPKTDKGRRKIQLSVQVFGK